MQSDRTRGCDMPGCNELASEKVHFICKGMRRPNKKIRYLCTGHAYILLGKEGAERIISCPVCSTKFGVM